MILGGKFLCVFPLPEMKKKGDGCIYPKGYDWLNDSSLVQFVYRPIRTWNPSTYQATSEPLLTQSACRVLSLLASVLALRSRSGRTK